MAGLSCIDICFCAGECQNPNKPAESEGEVSTDLLSELSDNEKNVQLLGEGVSHPVFNHMLSNQD